MLALAGCSADPSARTVSLSVGGPSPAPGFSHPPRIPPAPQPLPTPVASPAAPPTSPVAQAEPAPEPAPAPEPEPASAPEPVAPAGEILRAMAREVFVYQRPSFDSKRLGYLRWGARVTRSREPVGHAGCKGGFYRVAPEGYVCAGASARPELADAAADAASAVPERSAALPYVYARTRAPGTPLYVKLPSEAEVRLHETDVVGAAAPRVRGALAALPISAVPIELANAGRLPTPFGYAYEEGTTLAGRANFPSTLALLSVFEHGSRKFALTTDRTVVPLARLEAVKPSGFHGISLREAGLPLAFVLKHSAFLYSGRGAQRRPVRPLAHREAVLLTGVRERIGNVTWLETRTGDFIIDEGLVELDAPRSFPVWAKGTRSWISVSIERQALIAFEGQTPVYATLVSTGLEGGEPETSRATVRGQFLIHTKHVSATMDSDEVGDEYDLRDVPYVQYFKDGYALHAALWHDAFGAQRSHGCINLAPEDARWLFRWTDPPVPPAWHGAFSLREGTLIDIGP